MFSDGSSNSSRARRRSREVSRARLTRKAAGKPQRAASPAQTVRAIYRKLSRSWGPQHWWPAETPFEVIAGAILTQNTSWTNVERALANLRQAGVLSVEGIRGLRLAELEQLVRSSGYFRQKALRLKDFIAFLDEKHGGSLDAMLATPTQQLRAELLAQKGIGPETADSILLYAGHHPIFVVDAYTRRVLERHDAVATDAKYDEIRTMVEQALQRVKPLPDVVRGTLHQQRPASHPPSVMSTAPRAPLAQVYNEMHGLFVQLGKHYCHKQQPKCDVCPLGAMLRQPVPSGPSAQSAENNHPPFSGTHQKSSEIAGIIESGPEPGNSLRGMKLGASINRRQPSRVMSPVTPPNRPDQKRNRTPAIVGLSIAIFLLFAVIFSQATFNLTFLQPDTSEETLIFAALSALIFLLFVALTFVLLRILLRLYAERKTGAMGSRLRSRMVMGALLLSLGPVIFLFLFSYGLINRSIEKWFSRPVEDVQYRTGVVASLLTDYAADNARVEAERIAATPAARKSFETDNFTLIMDEFRRGEVSLQGGFAFALDDGRAEASFHAPQPWPLLRDHLPLKEAAENKPKSFDILGKTYVLGRAVVGPEWPDPGRHAAALELLLGAA